VLTHEARQLPAWLIFDVRQRKHDAITLILPGPQLGTNFHDSAFGAAEWAIKNETGGDVIETGNE
jgi:hypothetical protein